MEKVNKIKEIFEKHKQENDKMKNPSNERKVSVNIKERVKLFENQIEEYEKIRKSHNLSSIAKKFGLHNLVPMKANNAISKGDIEENENHHLELNGCNISEFLNEMQVLVENYEKEIDVYKLRVNNSNRKESDTEKFMNQDCNTNKSNTTCSLCDKLIKEIEKKNKIIQEKETEISSLKEENNMNSQRYQDFDTHINSMMNYLTDPTNSDLNIIDNSQFNLECFKENINNEKTEYHPNLNIEVQTTQKLNFTYPKVEIIIVDIICDNIFKDFELDNSVNINSFNEKLLSNNNFLNYFNTSFIKETRTSNTSLSIYNQYLEDIIVQIYLSFLAVNSQLKRDYPWVISEEDINDSIIKHTAEEIFSNYSCLNKDKSLKENRFSKENLHSFFEAKYLDQYNKNFPHLYQQVKVKFLSEVEKFILKSKDGICLLVDYCKKFIHAGKLLYKSNIIYDYWKLYNDYITFNQANNFNNELHTEFNYASLHYKRMNNRLYYYQSLEAPEFSDYLINNIRFTRSEIDTININGTVNSESYLKYYLPLSTILSCIINRVDISSRLSSLNITDCLLEDSSILCLTKIIELSPNLIVLNLNNNKIGDKGIRIISEILKINTSITNLHLAYNQINSNGGFYIADMLVKNKKIKNLYLGSNQIRDLGLQSLVNIIINNQSIKILDLSDNHLQDIDITVICNLIMKNCEQLEILNLSHNKFDMDSINTLGSSLKVNTNLKSLYLNNILLNEDTTPYFLQHLIDANLTEIYLDENGLGEVGGVLLANVLKYNHKFKKISLKNTSLNSVSLVCITHALDLILDQHTEGIEVICLDENLFDDDSIQSLINLIGKIHFKNSENKMNFKFPILSFSKDMLQKASIEKLITMDLEDWIII